MKKVLLYSGLFLSSFFLLQTTAFAGDLSIGGTLKKQDGTPISEAKVTLSSGQTVISDSDGMYLFTDLESGEDYTISVIKDGDFREGISILDLYAVRRNQGPNATTIDSLSSFETLILNPTGDEVFDILDQISMSSLIQYTSLVQGQPWYNYNGPSWGFVTGDFEFDKLLSDQTVRHEIEIKNLTEDSFENDFWGYKYGDLRDESDFVQTDVKPIIEIGTIETCTEKVILPIKLSNLQNNIGGQFQITWDSTLLRGIKTYSSVPYSFNGVIGSDHAIFLNSLFSRKLTDSIIIELEMEVIGDPNTPIIISVDPVNTDVQFLNENLEVSDAEYTSGEITFSPTGLLSYEFSTDMVFQPCGFAPTDFCVTGVGGLAPYSYLWDGGNTEPCQIMEKTNILNCKITDTAGCELVYQPDVEWLGIEPLEITNLFLENASSPAASDGRIQISIEGGTQPFNIVWSTGQVNYAVLEDIPPGSYSVLITDANGCTLEQTFEVQGGISSNSDLENSLEISLFPNPSDLENTAILKINSADSSNGTISVSDITGKKIWVENFQNKSQFNLPIVSAKGLYFIGIEFETGSRKTLKWVVE